MPSTAEKKSKIHWQILIVARVIILAQAILVLSLSPSIYNDYANNLKDSHSTPVPSRLLMDETGWAESCDYHIFLSGTTPMAHLRDDGSILAGTTGQDMGTFLNSVLTSNKKECFESGTYIFQSQYLINNIRSLSVVGQGNATVFQAGANLSSGDFIKVVASSNITIAYIKVIGLSSLSSGGGITVQSSDHVTIDHVVVTESPDNGIWLSGDKYVSLSHVVLTGNGNAFLGSPTHNNGGLEIDANSPYGPSDGIWVTDSEADNNFGPGFSVHNCNGSTSNPCATGTSPSNHLFFQNVLSQDNRNYGSAITNGVGFGLYHWNNTSCLNCRTSGNQYAGFFINGNTNGALTIIGSAEDSTSTVIEARYASPRSVRINIGHYRGFQQDLADPTNIALADQVALLATTALISLNIKSSRKVSLNPVDSSPKLLELSHCEKQEVIANV